MLLPSPASPNGVSKEFAKTGERVDKDSTGHDSSKGRKFDFPVAEAQKANSEKDGNDSPEDDDGEKEDLFQECIYMQRELKRREEMLNWFYEELEATSAESLGFHGNSEFPQGPPKANWGEISLLRRYSGLSTRLACAVVGSCWLVPGSLNYVGLVGIRVF